MNSNTLKLIGVISMTLDHIGYFLFPGAVWLRIAGRIAFPIFAYFIAEGCRHTRRPARYLCTLAGVGMLCSAVTYFADGSLYQCVLVTFAFSVALILLLRAGEKNSLWYLPFAALLTACFLLFQVGVIPALSTDYGFCGIVTPVLAYVGRTRTGSLCGLAAGLALVFSQVGGVQVFSFAALLLLAAYNGQRGRHRYKAFFYIYYPAHVAVIYGISAVLK